MDAEELLHTWLNGSALRHSPRAEYTREIGSFLTWCAGQTPPVDAVTARPKDIAAWAADCFLGPYLDGRPFDGPDALGHLADQHPEAARSHDRRISALTQYFEAAYDRGIITLPPHLTALRSRVPSAPGPPARPQYFEPAYPRAITPLPPTPPALPSGAPSPPGAKTRLDRMERAT